MIPRQWKHTTPLPRMTKEPSQDVAALFQWCRGFQQQYNAAVEASNVRAKTATVKGASGDSPTYSMQMYNARVADDSTFRQVDPAKSSWALRFDGTSDLFEILYAAAGTDPISWTQLWSTTSGGIVTYSQNIRWKSGTAFYGTLDHANTADRTYTYPDRNGTIAMVDGDETITGTWTFNELLSLVQNLQFKSGTIFNGILDHANTADRTYTLQNSSGTLAFVSDVVTDHGTLSGLSDDDHTGYARLSGRSGGQVLQGGTASGDDLTLSSTAHATKGSVTVGDSSGLVGFFGSLGTVKATISDHGALATTETAGAAYGANEQSMLGNLKADVGTLRAKINEILDDLQAKGWCNS